MNRQRLLSALVCLALCLILLPAAARAASYGTVYVGDVTLTNTADTPVVYARTDSDGNVTTEGATADAYNVMWDGSVLTLHNATIGEAQEYSGKGNESIAVYRGAGDLTIALVGENTIDAPGNGTAASCGINVNAGGLTIGGGDGASLKVFGGDTINGNSCGIYAFGTITIDSGTVNATGESAAGNSYGICANGSFTMGGGAVTATSGEAAGYSYGICVGGAVTIEDGSVNAASGEAAGESYGIYTSSSVTINGGSVTAASGNAVGGGRYSCGIRARASITIHNGTVNAAGGNSIGTGSDSYSIGLCADSAITINDGEVNATSGTTALNFGLSYGIYSGDVISIGGGMVTATGGAGNSWSTGIHCTGTDIVITGGHRYR